MIRGSGAGLSVHWAGLSGGIKAIHPGHEQPGSAGAEGIILGCGN
jgi:hypothetical protein